MGNLFDDWLDSFIRVSIARGMFYQERIRQWKLNGWRKPDKGGWWRGEQFDKEIEKDVEMWRRQGFISPEDSEQSQMNISISSLIRDVTTCSICKKLIVPSKEKITFQGFIICTSCAYWSKSKQMRTKEILEKWNREKAEGKAQ